MTDDNITTTSDAPAVQTYTAPTQQQNDATRADRAKAETAQPEEKPGDRRAGGESRRSGGGSDVRYTGGHPNTSHPHFGPQRTEWERQQHSGDHGGRSGGGNDGHRGDRPHPGPRSAEPTQRERDAVRDAVRESGGGRHEPDRSRPAEGHQQPRSDAGGAHGGTGYGAPPHRGPEVTTERQLSPEPIPATERATVNMPPLDVRTDTADAVREQEIGRNARDVVNQVDNTLTNSYAGVQDAVNDFRDHAAQQIRAAVGDGAAAAETLKSAVSFARDVLRAANAPVGNALNYVPFVTTAIDVYTNAVKENATALGNSLNQATQNLAHGVRDAAHNQLEAARADYRAAVDTRSVTDESFRQTLRGGSPESLDQAVRALGVNPDNAERNAYQQVRETLEVGLAMALAEQRFLDERSVDTGFHRGLVQTEGTDLNRQFQEYARPFVAQARDEVRHAVAERYFGSSVSGPRR